MTYPPCVALTLAAASDISLIRPCADRDEERFTGLLVYGKRTTKARIDIAPLWTVLSSSVHHVLTKRHLFDRAGEVYTEVRLAYSEIFILIPVERSYTNRAWFISAVGSGITASSPGTQLQLIALARATWQFPHAAQLALFTHGDRKFASLQSWSASSPSSASTSPALICSYEVLVLRLVLARPPLARPPSLVCSPEVLVLRPALACPPALACTALRMDLSGTFEINKKGPPHCSSLIYTKVKHVLLIIQSS